GDSPNNFDSGDKKDSDISKNGESKTVLSYKTCEGDLQGKKENNERIRILPNAQNPNSYPNIIKPKTTDYIKEKGMNLSSNIDPSTIVDADSIISEITYEIEPRRKKDRVISRNEDGGKRAPPAKDGVIFGMNAEKNTTVLAEKKNHTTAPSNPPEILIETGARVASANEYKSYSHVVLPPKDYKIFSEHYETNVRKEVKSIASFHFASRGTYVSQILSSRINELSQHYNDWTKQQAISAGDETCYRQFWVKFSSSNLKQKSNSEIREFKSTARNFTIGIDGQLLSDLLIFGAAITHSEINTKLTNSFIMPVNQKSNLITGSLYGRLFLPKNLLLDFSGSYSASYLGKKITENEIGPRLSSNFQSYEINLLRPFYIEQGIIFTPKIGLLYEGVNIKSFMIKDMGLKLIISPIHIDSLFYRAGISVSKTYEMKSGILAPELNFGFEKNIYSKSTEIDVSYSLFNRHIRRKFLVANDKKGIVRLGASLDLRTFRGIDIKLGVENKFKSGFNSNVGYVRASFNF
ncbi:MAG: autotransporter outer membrane beta-barrel domain-containing protein, partial [Rickettsiaceae bacterium]|nr:autotransporter outer membrane beta-barrel domain-containing protein [Rickettsiaceae bacterium]